MECLGEGLELEDENGLDELFQSATDHVKTIVGNLTSEELLYFYGRYKQSTVGSCNVDKPSFFDFTGKQKWNAWKNVGDITKVFFQNQFVKSNIKINY